MTYSQSIRILTAVRDGTAGWVMGQTLTDEGFIVDTAQNEKEGAALLKEAVYDLVVIDLSASRNGGFPLIDGLAPTTQPPALLIICDPDSEKAATGLLKRYFGDYLIKDGEGRYIEFLSFIIERTLDRHRLLKEKEETQQALTRVSDEKLAILNSMSEMVLFLDRDLNVMWANNTITESIGTSQTELRGRHCYHILMNNTEACENCPIITVRDTKLPQSAEIVSTDGRVWAISGYPIFSDDGDIEGIVEMKQDITERKKWEAKLTRASDEWRSTFDSIVDTVAINDIHFKLVKVNKAFADAFGLAPKELVGKTCHELFYGTLDPCPDCPQKKMLSAKKPSRIEYSESRLGDTIRVTASPVFSEKNEVVGFVTIGKDIAEQITWENKLTRASNEWRTTFDSIVDPISIIDGEFRLVKVNQAFADLLGAQPKELISKVCYEILHDLEAPCSHCPQPIAEGTKTTAITSYFDERQKKYLQITSSPVFDDRGDIVGFVNIKSDITEQKKEEESLKKHSGHLKKMVGQLSKELKDAQVQIIAKSQLTAQKQLAGRVGLDMKRSLAAITKAFQKEKEPRQEALRHKAVIEEIKGLERMAANLLFYSNKRPPKREEIVVSELITRVLDRNLPPDNVNMTLNIPYDIPYVFVDPPQIEHAIYNLVSNAIESMPEGGDLTIKAQKSASGVGISITDTGSGIPVKSMKRLFEPLFTTRPSGIGIGLTIARGLIEANGGTITVENNEHKGCTVSVFLPTTEAALKKDDVESLFRKPS